MVRVALVVASCALVLAAAAAPAQTRQGEPRLADSIEVVVLPRKLVAVGAGGGSVEEPLQLTEKVRLTRTHGDVAVAVTDRRILAIGVQSSTWSATRFRLAERPNVEVHMGERVTLLVTSQRLLGFGSPDGGRLVQRDIGPNESLLEQRVGEAVAVAVTNRQVLGLSADAGGFIPEALRIHEQLQGVSTRARSASVRTSQRLLVFDATTLTWSEERIPLY